MDHRLVIDGNAVYEIDQDCVRRQRERQERQSPICGNASGRYGQMPRKNGYGRSR